MPEGYLKRRAWGLADLSPRTHSSFWIMVVAGYLVLQAADFSALRAGKEARMMRPGPVIAVLAGRFRLPRAHPPGPRIRQKLIFAMNWDQAVTPASGEEHHRAADQICIAPLGECSSRAAWTNGWPSASDVSGRHPRLASLVRAPVFITRVCFSADHHGPGESHPAHVAHTASLAG